MESSYALLQAHFYFNFLTGFSSINLALQRTVFLALSQLNHILQGRLNVRVVIECQEPYLVVVHRNEYGAA